VLIGFVQKFAPLGWLDQPPPSPFALDFVLNNGTSAGLIQSATNMNAMKRLTNDQICTIVWEGSAAIWGRCSERIFPPSAVADPEFCADFLAF
jgi:hypothetical protein